MSRDEENTESKSPPVGEVSEPPKIKDRFDKPTDVRITNTSISSFIKRMAKDGRTKEDAVRLSGVGYEIVDKYYQEAKKERERER